MSHFTAKKIKVNSLWKLKKITSLPISDLFLGAFVVVSMMSMVNWRQFFPTEGIKKGAMLLNRFFIFHPTILVFKMVLGCKAQNGTHFEPLGFFKSQPLRPLFTTILVTSKIFFFSSLTVWPLVVLATTVASPSKAGVGAFLVFLAEPVEEEELLQCAEAQKAFFPCSHIIDWPKKEGPFPQSRKRHQRGIFPVIESPFPLSFVWILTVTVLVRLG